MESKAQVQARWRWSHERKGFVLCPSWKGEIFRFGSRHGAAPLLAGPEGVEWVGASDAKQGQRATNEGDDDEGDEGAGGNANECTTS